MAAVWEEKERTGSEGERLRRGKRGTRWREEREEKGRGRATRRQGTGKMDGDITEAGKTGSRLSGGAQVSGSLAGERSDDPPARVVRRDLNKWMTRRSMKRPPVHQVS